MNFFEAVAVVVVPLIPIVLPGAFFIRVHDFKNLLITGARIILWSMGILTLAGTAGLYGGISVQTIALVLLIAGTVNVAVHKRQFFSRPNLWHAMAMIIPMMLGLVIFAIPFFIIHDGLPTGDVQKTIIWATQSLITNHLPDYSVAPALLNRDGVDFYTPGLHAVASLILGLSPSPLVSIGIFSIAIALCVAWIAGALTKEMFDPSISTQGQSERVNNESNFDNHPHIVPPILAGIFTLTQYRFLRYLREPGYHIQNLVGELLLFGTLLLLIRFIRRREKQDAVLCIVTVSALFLTHQFSMFIALFALTAAMIATVLEYRTRIITVMKLHAHISLIIMFCLLVALGIASSLQLGNKLSSIFTRTPHLTGLLPAISDYPATMGEVWFLTGITGIILMVWRSRRRDEHHRQVIAFASATAAILILSQGPAIGIDIPPVRALFYIVVPFSVGAAYLFGTVFLYIRHNVHGRNKRISQLAVGFVIIAVCTSSTYKAYASLSHIVRTNSTLTGEELGLIERLHNPLPTEVSAKAGILIDDYNRRSASWLVLSGRPMFTRIAADLRQQMEEARQSTLRMDLYIKQLDFEKIFSLGSMPEITTLLQKYGIGAVTGITNTSQTAFMHNSALAEFAVADDSTMYRIKDTSDNCATSASCKFLLRSATLANDIGDMQDTFEHLQASIRSSRLSEPIIVGNTTYRQSTASRIPFVFNVGDYVRVLWDPNKNGRPESSLTFMVNFIQPYTGLSLRTPTGEIIPLPIVKHATVELRQHMVTIDDRGFVTLTLINPTHEFIGIDLIALGPSLLP